MRSVRRDARKLRLLLLAGAAVAGDLLLLLLTGYSVPCVFRCITGWKCPGCGVTHMLTALLALDWKEAYGANPFLFVTSPFLVFEIIYEFFCAHSNRRLHQVNTVLLWIYCAALLLFGVVRNLRGI